MTVELFFVEALVMTTKRKRLDKEIEQRVLVANMTPTVLPNRILPLY